MTKFLHDSKLLFTLVTLNDSYMRKIGILIGGGECPGVNSIIKSIIPKCLEHNIEVYGFRHGWEGVLNNDVRKLTVEEMDEAHILGCPMIESSRVNILLHPDAFETCKVNIDALGLESLIVIGGDDTLGVADHFHRKGINLVGIPKTIDNDLSGTDYSFGFDTASYVATEAIDRLHTNSKFNSRCFVVEVMGRHTGWIALQAGLAAGAHVVLIPEFPRTLDEIAGIIEYRRQNGKFYTIICVAEGFELEEMNIDYETLGKDDYGNIRMEQKQIAANLSGMLEAKTGIKTRFSVLGHMIRGGVPTAFDRVLGSKFGSKAVELIAEKQYGYMVALQGSSIVAVDLEKAIVRKKVDEAFYHASGYHSYQY